MTSLLTKYAQQEIQLQQLTEQFEKMKADPRLQAELDFKQKLEGLMQEYDKGAADVLALLNPKPVATHSAQSHGTARRKRKLKIYENPKTGEVVETRGGNQKTLKQWKEVYGDETVESWVIRVEG